MDDPRTEWQNREPEDQNRENRQHERPDHSRKSKYLDDEQAFAAEYDAIERRANRVRFIIAMVVLLLAIAGIALRERGHRHLTQLKAQLHAQPAAPAAGPPRPGGQDPIIMTRSQVPGSLNPEFLSVTLLPGRGMNVFQITAGIPGVGEVPLLASPTLDEAAKVLSGTGSDANGTASTTMGGAFVLPWAGQLTGAPDGKNVSVIWNGHNLVLPGSRENGAEMTAAGGLLLLRGADSLKPDVMPDGGVTQATFNVGDFDGHWPSKTTVTVTVLLSGRVIDLTVAARNTGPVPEPMGIGWLPWFALAGDRTQARLQLPGSMRAEETTAHLPTGRIVPVEGAYDFTARGGMALGNKDINSSFIHPRSALLDNGPEVALIQPDQGYGLRMTALTSTIRAIRVVAPAGKNAVSIQPSFNINDPFGHEWPHEEENGMVMLQPGQTTQWKVRLELFSLARSAGPQL